MCLKASVQQNGSIYFIESRLCNPIDAAYYVVQVCDATMLHCITYC
jgi:hypothetical protein